MTPRYDLPIAAIPWPVPRAGFDWVDAPRNWRIRGEKFLVGIDSNSVEYTDLAVKEPALYRVFADTPPKPDAILAFANRYGALGVTVDAMGQAPDLPFDEQADRLDLTSLGQVAGWSSDDWKRLLATVGRLEDTNPRVQRAIMELRKAFAIQALRVGDPFNVWVKAIRDMKAAVSVLDRVHTSSATPDDRVAACLLAFEGLYKGTRVLVTPTRKTQALALHVWPLNLFGLMWVQYGLAITGSRKHVHCDGCGRWFEVSAEHEHGKRGYCNNACKARAYRGRKERARGMASEGKGPGEIAEALGSTPGVVRRWVRDMKPS